LDKPTRNSIQRATQAARKLLEDAYSDQLEGTYDILLDGTIAEHPGDHLSDRQRVVRDKLVATVMHKRSGGASPNDAVDAYLREAAFTTLNRFVALKMLEARGLVQECVSKAEESAGFREFTMLAPGLAAFEDKGYRLYIETVFDEVGQEVRVLFDRRDVASLLWPDRQTLLLLLGILNAPDLAGVWGEDETIGWVYQYFNGDDERAKMRDTKRGGSQAPRNSRELAVRNQFFTPRYVVQFLTDNTLGRTWYEMMQGSTQLADLDYLVRRPNEAFLAEGASAPESGTSDGDLSQEERLQQTVHVPFRAKKDPRDLRILDPACGSGHFLLYTFDLLITIYEEAYADAGAAAFTETGAQLRADYESVEDLRHASPGLILRNNLHGVDIDPRAAQIAALAVWMRAQRAYNEFDVDRAQRPPITRTNIVVAEPMPGDAELVDEFAASLKPAVLGDLFKKMVEEMRLAGELGALLKIDDSISVSVSEARLAFAERQNTLSRGFLPGMEPAQGALDLTGIDEEAFFDEAEAKIIAALGSFSQSAAGASGVGRQLFAGDAAQGVAFIELMRKRFDVVLMNPPFGAGSKSAKREFETAYPCSKHDIYAAFIERWACRLVQSGCLGAITSRTGFFLSSFDKWRKHTLLKRVRPKVLADLGFGVLDDAMVEVAAYCVWASDVSSTTFFKLIASADKKRCLVSAISARRAGVIEQTFDRNLSAFADLPGAPFAYWVSERTRRVFKDLPQFESEGRAVRFGLASHDDFRWLRLNWECDPREVLKGIAPSYAKGGSFSRYYDSLHLRVAWGPNGRWLKTSKKERHRRGEVKANNSQCWNEAFYFRPGVTWPRRTNGLSFRALPGQSIFGDKGPAAFVEGDDVNDLLGVVGVLNSSCFGYLVSAQLARTELAQSYEVGIIRQSPFPPSERISAAGIADLVREGWALARELDSSNETSVAFVQPMLLYDRCSSLSHAIASTIERTTTLWGRLDQIQADLDKRCFELYGLSTAELEPIADFARQGQQIALRARRDRAGSGVHNVIAFLSWSFGAAVGRFDVGVAVRNQQLPAAGAPFEPLPLASPGMLADEEGLPLSVAPSRYPIAFTVSGILVDDAGHESDLVARAKGVFDLVLDEPEAWWRETAAIVAAPGHNIRRWFAKSFFANHIREYSRSRRKAPIYWQLATPSASYSVWCYYHRLTRDTFFQIADEYVSQKVDHEERKLNTLREEAGTAPSSKTRREIDAQETYVAELHVFLTEVKRIAPLWNPSLNDGVIINFAPLWRLVPQHKPWQKECKKVWDRLCNGDYDWAHLAMHLWPERVVPKCRDDRSLAIAHGLEDEFWIEEDDGKKTRWRKRQVRDGRVAELVEERSSAAVKAALNDLLTAPAPAGTGRRRKRRGAA